MSRVFVILSMAAPLCLAGCSLTGGGGDELMDMAAPVHRRPLTGPGAERPKRGEFPPILFQGNAWAVDPAEARKGKETAKALKERTETVILFGGSSVEPPEYARQLGQLRAEAVKRMLVDHGVAESRVLTTGYGQDLPSGKGGSERVDISLAAAPPPTPAVAARAEQ